MGLKHRLYIYGIGTSNQSVPVRHGHWRKASTLDGWNPLFLVHLGNPLALCDGTVTRSSPLIYTVHVQSCIYLYTYVYIIYNYMCYVYIDREIHMSYACPSTSQRLISRTVANKKNFAATQLKASAPCYHRPRRGFEGFEGFEGMTRDDAGLSDMVMSCDM